MNFALINYSEWVIAMVLQNIFIVFSLPCKRPKVGRTLQMLMLFALQIVPLTIKFIYNGNPNIRNAMLLLTVVGIMTYQILMQEGKLFKKVLFTFLMLAMNFLGELAAFMVMGDQVANMPLKMDTAVVFSYLVYQFIFSNLFMLLFYIVWIKILRGIRLDVRYLAAAFLFPCSQVLMIYSMTSVVYEEEVSSNVTVYSVVGLIVSLLADIYLMYVILQDQQKKELEETLSQMETERALSSQHYAEIERRREDLAKIRHDINNQLSAIGGLIATGNTGKASEMLKGLGKDLLATTEYPYCADPVVNAVLTENQGTCSKKGITFDTDVHIPVELQISPLKVCSLFSNLLKNAVAAAGQCNENRKITLGAELSGDYLNVKVVNSCLEGEVEKKKDRKHYGLEILKQIAQEGNGFFEYKKLGSQFESFLSVENK